MPTFTEGKARGGGRGRGGGGRVNASPCAPSFDFHPVHGSPPKGFEPPCIRVKAKRKEGGGGRRDHFGGLVSQSRILVLSYPVSPVLFSSCLTLSVLSCLVRPVTSPALRFDPMHGSPP